MKLTILSRITGTAVLAVLAMPTQIMAQGEQAHKREHFAHYRVTDLGTLGGTYSFAFGLNNAGEVAGGSATPNQTDFVSQTAFLWTKQTGMRDLGTLGGFNTVLNSAAGGPNAKGEAALISETFMTDPNGEDFCGLGTHRQCLGAIWKDGAMSALLPLGGNNSQAYWINNQGQVVGFAENRNREDKGYCLTPFQILDFEAVIWEPNGEIRELPPLAGDTVGFAFGINDHGQAVGASGSCSDIRVPPQPPGPTASKPCSGKAMARPSTSAIWEAPPAILLRVSTIEVKWSGRRNLKTAPFTRSYGPRREVYMTSARFPAPSPPWPPAVTPLMTEARWLAFRSTRISIRAPSSGKTKS
jgi:probable HAF family extracellular repeat protein